jgi:hypothetical protein
MKEKTKQETQWRMSGVLWKRAGGGLSGGSNF